MCGRKTRNRWPSAVAVPTASLVIRSAWPSLAPLPTLASVASTFDLRTWPRHSRVKRFSSGAAKPFSRPPVDLKVGVDEGVDRAPVGWR